MSQLGTDGDDNLFAEQVTAYALDGEDVVYAAGNAYYSIYGGEGRDYLQIRGEVNGNVYGGESNDTLSGGEYGDFLYGDRGFDLLEAVMN